MSTNEDAATESPALNEKLLDPTTGSDGNDADEPTDGAITGDNNPGALSSFALFMMSINFVIGIGLLDLPYIFYQSGIVSCIVLTTLATLASQLGVHYVVDTHARGVLLEKVLTLFLLLQLQYLGCAT